MAFSLGNVPMNVESAGIERRGRLASGYFADIVVFDPVRYAPKADYIHPRVLSEGVQELLVNGRLAIRAGELTGEAPGRVLLRKPPADKCR